MSCEQYTKVFHTIAIVLQTILTNKIEARYNA